MNIIQYIKTKAAAFINTYSALLDGSGDSFDATQLSGSDQHTFTLSTWAKFNSFPVNAILFEGGSTNYSNLYMNTSGQFFVDRAGATVLQTSTSVLTGTWYHIMLVVDNGNASIFIDGVEASYSTESQPSPGSTYKFGGTENFFIGSRGGSGQFLDGHLDETAAVWGSALTYANFVGGGLPKDLSSLTPDHWLRFEGETFTGTRWNPVDENGAVLSNEYKTFAGQSSADFWWVRGTPAVSSGQYHLQITTPASITGTTNFGVSDAAITPPLSSTPADCWTYISSGNKNLDGSSSSYGTSWSGSVNIDMLIDLDAGTMRFFHNGSDQGEISGITFPSDVLPFISTGNTNAFVLNPTASPPAGYESYQQWPDATLALLGFNSGTEGDAIVNGNPTQSTDVPI